MDYRLVCSKLYIIVVCIVCKCVKKKAVPADFGEQGRLIVDLNTAPPTQHVSLTLHQVSQCPQGSEAQVPAVTHPVVGPQGPLDVHQL